MKYKIYGLIHPDSNKICYIGYTEQTLGVRCSQHNCPIKSNKSYIANSKRSLGKKKFEITLISTHETVEEMYEAEINTITAFKKLGFKLYNLQEGGKTGTVPYESILKRTETRKTNRKPRYREDGNQKEFEDKVLRIYKLIRGFYNNSEICKIENIKKSALHMIRSGEHAKELFEREKMIYIPSIKNYSKDIGYTTKIKLKIVDLISKSYALEHIRKHFPKINKFDFQQISKEKIWQPVWHIYRKFYKASCNSNIV